MREIMEDFGLSMLYLIIGASFIGMVMWFTNEITGVGV